MKNASRSPLIRKMKQYTAGMVTVILGINGMYSHGDMNDSVYFASMALTLGIWMYSAIRLARPAAILCPFDDWQTFWSKFSNVAAAMDYLPEGSGDGYWEFKPAPAPGGRQPASKENSNAQQHKLRVELTASNTARISGIAAVVKHIRRTFANTTSAKADIPDPSLRRRTRFVTAGVVLLLIVFPLIVIVKG